MPTIEMVVKSYTVTQWGKPGFNWDGYDCPGNWLDLFSEYIYRNLSEETKNKKDRAGIVYITKDWVKNNIQRTTNPLNSNSDRVQVMLVRFFAVMTKAVQDLSFSIDPDNVEQRMLIAEKIAEGIEQCAEGLENRLNDILASWQEPRNFAERLESMRKEIVLRVARSLSDETHAQNTVSKVAVVFGTKAINPHDEYRGVLRDLTKNELEDQDILDVLQRAFDKEYTVILAVQHLEEQIRSALVIHGYCGKNSSEKGYAGVMKFVNVLNTTLLTKPTNEWLIKDHDNDAVRDVNWPLIRKEILKKLTVDELINNPDHIEDISKILPKNSVETEYWLSCDPNEEDIDRWIATFNSLDEEIQADCKSLCFLPDGHNYLEKLKAKYANYTPDNSFGMLRQQWLKTPRLFKNTQFISRMQPILLRLSKNELDQLLYDDTTLTSILHALLQHGTMGIVASFLEILKQKLSNEKLAILLGKVNLELKNVWEIATLSKEKLLCLVSKNLKGIDQLEQNDRFKILSQLTACDENVLMLAVQYQPGAVPALLKAMGGLTPPQQFEILSKVTIDDWSALMLATHYQPKAVPALLKAMGRLTPPQQFEILSKVTTCGWSALMFAVVLQPKAVPVLLKAMGELTPPQRFEILSKVTIDGRNVLMLAALHQPKALPALLKAMGGLTPLQQFEILSKINNERWSALMFAALKHQPDAVLALLKTMAGLTPLQQFAILSEVNTDGWNALMFAVRNQPVAVPALLETMGGLTPLQQFAILSEVNTDGWNALMLAVRNQPVAVPALLETINKLDAYEQCKILTCAINSKIEMLIKMSHVNGNQLLEVLRLIKDRPNKENIIEFILKFEKKLSPEDWYKIANENLISAELIKSKKEEVYHHIESLKPENRQKIIDDSLNKNTHLGAFFYTKRGWFFKCSEEAGTLKKLKDLSANSNSRITNNA